MLYRFVCNEYITGGIDTWNRYMLGSGCFYNPKTLDDANKEPFGSLNDGIGFDANHNKNITGNIWGDSVYYNADGTFFLHLKENVKDGPLVDGYPHIGLNDKYRVQINPVYFIQTYKSSIISRTRSYDIIFRT